MFGPVELVDDLLDDIIQNLLWGLSATRHDPSDCGSSNLIEGQVGSMPGAEQDRGVRAVAVVVLTGRGTYAVPIGVWSTVNAWRMSVEHRCVVSYGPTRDLIPGQQLALVDGLQPLETQQIQIPLIGILTLHLTNLQPKWHRAIAAAARLDAGDAKGAQLALHQHHAVSLAERFWMGHGLDQLADEGEGQGDDEDEPRRGRKGRHLGEG